jgi:hypothetical protein
VQSHYISYKTFDGSKSDTRWPYNIIGTHTIPRGAIKLKEVSVVNQVWQHGYDIEVHGADIK